MQARMLKALCCLCFTLPLPPLQAGSESQGPDSCISEREFDLGSYAFKISSTVPEAQKYFNEGINWAYGFNHGEAERAFRDALQADPNCAMCYWGIAFVLGPNINAPMAPEAVPRAMQALEAAKARMNLGSPRERAYIAALATRYQAQPPSDRAPLDRAFAEAMQKLAARYPDDPDAAVIAVEAMMDTMPWNYWTAERKPKPETKWMFSVLDKVLEKNPLHPGANHYLIHVAEAVMPEKASLAADRLLNLMPAAGHMQHMPSHIYIRTGRYHEGTLSNQIAIKADQEYLASCHSESFYEMMYVPHNFDFLIATASLEGRSALALEHAYALRDYVTPHLAAMPEMWDLQQFAATPYWTLARFKQWSKLLAEPDPGSQLPYARAIWHYSRTRAFAAQGALREAELELSKLKKIAKAPIFETGILAGLNPVSRVLAIGVEQAIGAVALAQKDAPKAIVHFEKAVALQDSLIYIEPPAWYQSVRLDLGEALLKSQQPLRAEKVFREDLKNFPANGWALAGLYQSLMRQSFVSEAREVQRELNKAWQYADIPLPGAKPEQNQ